MSLMKKKEVPRDGKPKQMSRQTLRKHSKNRRSITIGSTMQAAATRLVTKSSRGTLEERRDVEGSWTSAGRDLLWSLHLLERVSSSWRSQMEKKFCLISIPLSLPTKMTYHHNDRSSIESMDFIWSSITVHPTTQRNTQKSLLPTHQWKEHTKTHSYLRSIVYFTYWYTIIEVELQG